MNQMQIRKRPKNLNLLTIRLPINAVVSILHRISGMVLFLVLPFLLWAMRASLQSVDSYAMLAHVLQHWVFKLILIGFAWAFSHHFFAGLRHLGQDVHWMSTLQKARFFSRLVLVFSALSVLVFAVLIW